MEFICHHPDKTRATETSFESGDVIGLFVTESGKPLEISGNVVNNARFTLNGNSWTSSRPLYWDEGSFNIFAHYPYTNQITSITDLEFEVKTDQRDKLNGEMSGYEASDILIAKATGISPSSDPVSLQFRHIMSKITIRLIKGEDYDGELPENGSVYIHNTVIKSTVDLEAGVVTKDMYGEQKTIIARQISPSTYTAIVVPQRLDTRVPLVEVILNGVSYLYESKFQFKPGMHHIVNLVIDENPDQLKIEIGGGKTSWN